MNPKNPARVISDTQWTCEVSALPNEAGLEGLTVGSKFSLKCAGAEVADFNTQAFSLELPKADKYRLRILENKKSTTSSVELIVTSYVPGDTSLRDVLITDGQNRIVLNGVNFNVKSVIKEDEKDPKPFPQEPPVGLNWPTSVLVAIGLTAFLLVILMLALVQRNRRRANFKQWLRKTRTPLSPFDQLNKDLRRVTKERDPAVHIAELELATQTYLSRLYEAPLQTRSPRPVLRAIAGGDRKARARVKPIVVRLLGEFDRVSASIAKSQIDSKEALNVVLPQLHDLVREFAEKVQAEFKKRPGRMS